MQHDPPILQCPNYFCQAINPESHQFCHNCRTALPKRYLWAINLEARSARSTTPQEPGDLVADRYLVKQANVVLDTKPGMPPEMPADVTPRMEPYLRLVSQRLHVPQLYAVLDDGILLLEDAPIYPGGARTSSGQELTGELMPALTEVWHQSSALRQLNWLWQLAQLWQALSDEKAAATLLEPSVVRVDGGTVRLLELVFDRSTPPTLADLGAQWSSWQGQPAIAHFLTQVCQNLIDGQITQPEQLIDVLDQALATHGQQQTRQIQIATCTDQGPSRQSNEDACYPTSGTSFTTALDRPDTAPIVIVCDGIGGHEGGEVASSLAIQTITRQAKKEVLSESPTVIMQELEAAVCAANDVISEQNDTEGRQERQRMGTTVVMGLAHAHELYITHVGDSRAYRITRTGCYQVTLDDDVATREVRLGYTLYRDALQHPSAGSLVQALGMGSSSYLHPNVQRFVLDEDCVFLLCSDGLSDNDRVDECWQTDIAPILDGKLDLSIAARQLIEIANTRNGHDNVTVGLIHCRVQDQSGADARSIPAALGQPTQIVSPATTVQTRTPSPSTIKTQISRTQIAESPSKRWLSLCLSLMALFGVAGIVAALFVKEIPRSFAPSSSTPAPSPSPAAPATISLPSPTPLYRGSIVALDRPSSEANPRLGLPLLRKSDRPPVELSGETLVGQIPPGTILRVIQRNPATPDQPTWLQLQVCKPGETEAKLTNWVKPRDIGWQQETTIAPLVTLIPNPKPEQLGACAPSPANSPENGQDNNSQPR